MSGGKIMKPRTFGQSITHHGVIMVEIFDSVSKYMPC